MPGTVTKLASKKKEVTAQETFRYTTPEMRVTARPVDAYVEPGKPRTKDNSGLDALVAGLQSISKAVQSKQGEWYRENYEKGQVMAFKGEEPPPGSPEAMWRGNQNFKGQADVTDLAARHEDLLLRSQTMTPDEFQNELGAVTKEFTAGKSDQYLVGLMKGGAMGLEKKTLAAYRKMTVSNFKEDTASAMATAFQGYLNNAESLDPQSLRDSFTDFQERAVAAGVPRKTATDRLLDVVGPMAIRAGKPELMQFANLKDKHGIVLAATDSSEKVLSYLNQSLHSKDRIEANTLRDAKRQEKESQDFAETEALKTMYTVDPSDPQFRGKMSGIITTLDQYAHKLEPEKYKMLRKEAETLMEKGGYRKYRDEAKYLEAYDKASTGELNMTEYVPHLDKSSINHLLTVNSSAKNKMSSHAYSQSVTTSKLYLKTGMESVMGPKDLMGSYEDGAKERAEEFTRLYLRRLEEARQSTQDGSLPHDVIKDIRDRSIVDVLKEKPVVAPVAPSAGKSGGTGPTKQPAGGKSAPTQATAEAKPQDAMSRLDRLIGSKKGQ